MDPPSAGPGTRLLQNPSDVCSGQSLHQSVVSCFTFKEDEFPIRPLVGGVNARRQTSPELIDLHGVTLLDLVVPQTPKPAVLEHNVSTIRLPVEPK